MAEKGLNHTIFLLFSSLLLLGTPSEVSARHAARRYHHHHAKKEHLSPDADISGLLQNNFMKLTDTIDALSRRIESLEKKLIREEPKETKSKKSLFDNDSITKLEHLEDLQVILPSTSEDGAADESNFNILFSDDPGDGDSGSNHRSNFAGTDNPTTEKPVARINAIVLSRIIAEQITSKTSYALETTLNRVMEAHLTTVIYTVENILKQNMEHFSINRQRFMERMEFELDLQTEIFMSEFKNFTKNESTCRGELKTCRLREVTRSNTNQPTNSTLVIREKGGVSLQQDAIVQNYRNGPETNAALLCTADESTITALSEVKSMLTAVLNANEDLKKTVTNSASKGIELLEVLHSRFASLIRRLNYQPDKTQALMSEMRELENLVANSYSSILTAQNMFIQSCHRIQDEEPVVEAKITDILDKVLTSISLGQQYNREQLRELRRLLNNMKYNGNSSSTNVPIQELKPASPDSIMSVDLSLNPVEIDEIEFLHERVMRNMNISSIRLHDVAARVSEVQNQLTSWSLDNSYKNELDQLVTAAKDLFGSARLQLDTLEDVGSSITSIMNISHSSVLHGRLYIGNSHLNNSVLLPQVCTEAVSIYLDNNSYRDENISDALPNLNDIDNEELDYYEEPDIQYDIKDLQELSNSYIQDVNSENNSEMMNISSVNNTNLYMN